ncbi:MAG: homoserine dehydrogenase [Desulfobacterales bacterium]|nr:homoserine dehydrogenase [Desulfobacterales bacterium]MDX2511356.1 homoserine dehydrogenase [Desulfobacterales bacterium]
MRKSIQIGLLGLGTVGTGVARMLIQNRELLEARVGVPLTLKYIADIDFERDRGIQLDASLLTSDAFQVVNDPEVDIVVEMIGGDGIAKALILKALENGKPVVTANKALLARHGNQLFKNAMDSGVDLAYEASVGGCMPIIKTLRESLVGNRIQSMTGILNGTCNYILSKITDEGIEFDVALERAKANGYAEADPTLDVEGFDTAHKLAILTSLGYGMEINFDDIYIEGISKITPLDIAFAGQFGYRIKLLAITKIDHNTVEARVHPAMIPFDNLLSNVNSTLNAITVTADAVGDILLYGHGAGMMPTASAVIGDIVDIARNLLMNTSGRVPLMSYQMNHVKQVPVMPIRDITTHYYFRFSAQDKPGVLSTISGILGKHGISLKSVNQKGRKTEGSVPVVMLSHLAREEDVQNALAEIRVLDVVSRAPMLIRIEDDNYEE